MDLKVGWSPEATEDRESVAEYVLHGIQHLTPEQLLQTYWRFLEISRNSL